MPIKRHGFAFAVALAAVGLTSCGGGGKGPDPVSVGGIVSGLAGSGLVLADNGTAHLHVSANGYFSFATPVPPGGAFDVTVVEQPANPTQTCVVGNGSGETAASGVVGVTVTCTTNHYTVGGTVSGLLGSPLVLQDNGGDTLSVAADGSFTFATPVVSGGAYSVTVLVEPKNPVQGCHVSKGRGTVAGSNVSSVVVACATSELNVLAGNMGGAGTADGIGAAARFDQPEGVATDTAGNVYVADTGSNTIRKITPSGVVTTLAGAAGQAGSTDGIGVAARFSGPAGVATDKTGNVYVADALNNTIRKITPSGTVTTLAGKAGTQGSDDGMGTDARFWMPTSVATDAAGNVYVADSNNWTIRKITPEGVVTTLAGEAGESGSADGTGSAARFLYPSGVATDAAGNVYVADTENDTIRKITAAGVVTTLAGRAGVNAYADGVGTAARFNMPQAVTVDRAGNIYVGDLYNSAIRKITPAAVVTTLTGVALPYGVAANAAGDIYVADEANSVILKITPAAVVSTLAGAAPVQGAADGTGTAAQFTAPLNVAADPAGNVYVTDVGYHGYPDWIRKITPAGVVSMFAADDTICGSGNYCYLGGITTDAAGNVYAGDVANCTVRKFTAAGVATTLAGRSALCDGAQDIGLAGLAADAAGNIYVADDVLNTIRKITPSGAVTTLAGHAGVSGSADGTGTAATFHAPSAVALDGAANVYVADSGNYTVRKISPAGVVTTLAGQAGVPGSADGVGSAATLVPVGIATDADGNLYVADGGATIRKITPAGVVSTVVGVSGQSGFRAGPLTGLIGVPNGVAISGTSLYITMFYGVAVVRNFP